MNNQADWSFYHALYHLVTHWAATVTILVLLLTVGVILLTTSGPMRIWQKVCACLVIAITAALPIYFLERMATYGAFVTSQLPAEYVTKVDSFPHSPINLYLGIGIVCVVAAIDMTFVILSR